MLAVERGGPLKKELTAGRVRNRSTDWSTARWCLPQCGLLWPKQWTQREKERATDRERLTSTPKLTMSRPRPRTRALAESHNLNPTPIRSQNCRQTFAYSLVIAVNTYTHTQTHLYSARSESAVSPRFERPLTC